MCAKEVAPRLGRGLAALLGDAPPGSARPNAITNLPIDALEPGPFQPRTTIEPEPLEELAASIRQQGVLQPLLARPHPQQPGRYQIIAGERRWRASQMAKLHEIPVLVRELSDTDSLAAGLVENLQREDLNPLEEAEGYRRLMEEFYLTQEKLAAAVGKTRSHVSNSLRLLQLPAPVLGEVRKGSLSPGHARALMSHPDPERAMLSVMAKGLTVRQTEVMANEATRPSTKLPPAEKDANTIALEQMLTQMLGLRTEINHADRGGSLTVRYRTLDQLEGLVVLLRGGN